MSWPGRVGRAWRFTGAGCSFRAHACPLVYRHACHGTARCISSSTSSRGLVSRPRSDPAVSAGARGRGAGRRRSRDPLRTHRLTVFCRGCLSCSRMVVGSIVLSLGERRLAAERLSAAGRGRPRRDLARPRRAAVRRLLCRGGYVAWPGLHRRRLCAAIGAAATRPLFARVRARLDAGAAAALPLYAEGVGAAARGALGPRAAGRSDRAARLLWLLIAGRGRGEQKYAGLRILR